MSPIRTQWSRLIRFVAAETSQVHLGQPVDSLLDVGLAAAQGRTIKAHEIVGSALDISAQVTNKVLTVKELLSPLAREEVKYVRCLGLNYVDHAAEANIPPPELPVLFVKPVSSLIGPCATVVIPKAAQPANEHLPDYEVELVIVIGKLARDVSEKDALDYVLGYTGANDVSFRKHQMAVSQWTFSKGFDDTNPFGPCIVSTAAITDPQTIPLKCTVNGAVMQDGNTRDQIFSVRKTIAFLSQGTTLEPGSLILTGTPKGVGFVRKPPVYLKDGDSMSVWLGQGIGTRPSVPIPGLGHTAASPSVATSATRVGKSSDSHAFGHAFASSLSHSTLSSSASATPQQKIVQVLVQRIKLKLPYNSGMDLIELEADTATQQALEALVTLTHDSMDIISWALSELLERLAIPDKDKPQPHPTILTNEVIQSQLYVMKVLSMALASRWNQSNRPSSRASNDSPAPSRTRFAADQRSIQTDLPPLDDNCAKYVLSVMVLYLRQTHSNESPLMIEDQTTDLAFDDYELGPGEMNLLDTDEEVGNLRPRASVSSLRSITASVSSSVPSSIGGFKYERTKRSAIVSPQLMNGLLAKFAGRVIFQISASNWPVVFNRLRSKLHHLAGGDMDRKQTPDLVDLQLLAHSALNRERLRITELAALLLNIKEEHQLIAPVLRAAVWNWIDQYPDEFNETIRTRGALEGVPERMFDLLYKLCSTPESQTQKQTWPTLAILNSISSDRLASDLMNQTSSSRAKTARPNVQFSEDIIRHAQIQSKLSETALVCAVDLCRVASRNSKHVSIYSAYCIVLISTSQGMLRHPMYNGQKPFWDLDEIDVALYGQALAAIFRFLPEQDSLLLFEECLMPERSDAVKLCVVRACLTLIQEAPRLPWQRSLDKLVATISPRLQAIFANAGRKRGEIDQNRRPQRPQAFPKIKHRTPNMLQDNEIFMLGIAAMWRGGPSLFASQGENAKGWLNACLRLWESTLHNAVKASMLVNLLMIPPPVLKAPSLGEHAEASIKFLQYALPNTLFSTSSNLLRTRSDTDTTLLWTSALTSLLDIYLIRNPAEHSQAVRNHEDRAPALALVEISLLVTLTTESMPIAQMAAKGLRTLAKLEARPDAPPPPVLDDDLISKRHLVYEQLGDPRVVVVGRVGYQKRIRKFIRLLSFPSAIHVAVWEECYYRWLYLYNLLKDNLDEANSTPETREDTINAVKEKRIAYENLSMFLASLGGACVQDGINLRFLSTVIPPQYLPDQLRELQQPAPLVSKFLYTLTDELVSEDSQMREISKTALGSELSPRLYSRLLRHFDDTIRQISVLVTGSELAESHILFVDQFSAVLKLIIESTPINSEEIMSIDISGTMHSLASFIGRFDAYAALRLRLRFCILCDAVCDRADLLTIRRDSPARQRILDILAEWMQTLPEIPSHSPEHLAQTELNFACLRTCVKLLDRLQIRPPEEAAAGDDSAHSVSRLFHKYSSLLLRGHIECQLDDVRSDNVSEAMSLHKKNRVAQREAELRELVITGLTHMVSANSEHGFKQCLPLAYGSDLKKRAIFASVFARVISQGTKFEIEAVPAAVNRHSRLLELVKGSNMVLVMAICETCPQSEVEIMVSVMLNLFDTRSTLMALLKYMIEREVAATENESQLFRSNTTCTRFLSAFAKVHGYTYLRSLIIPLIKAMAAVPPGHGYELDPDKPDVGEAKAAQNLENVKVIASTFLEIISMSLPTLPAMFREICTHISKVVQNVWPDCKFSAMGAFIFLRFISPAIVAPETIDVEIPKDLTREEQLSIRRGLMIITKIIQNLANNLFFGKEKHMVPLNAFLADNIAIVTRFLSELQKYTPSSTEDETDEWSGTTTDDTDIIVLHRYFHKHADKIGKELLSLSKPSDVDPTAMSGKHAWDELCGLLVELGTPLDIPKLSLASSIEHRDYLDLMARHAHRSTDSVRSIFVETDSPLDKPAVFLFNLAKIDVEVLDIELLMYHIFKTLSLPIYQNRTFDVILDCTAFTGISELPLQWLKFCAELIPYDIRTRFATTHILNSNTLTQKYMRRLYNFAAGTPFCGSVRAHSSVIELGVHVPRQVIDKLGYPSSLEAEVGSQFAEISMRLQQSRFPISMLVGETHLRITSTRAQPISPGLTCKATEIIPLSDVSDVYNVSSIGQDTQEFIIRRSQQGATVYFSSASREAIVKAIRSAKGRLKDTSIPLAERFSRFSNIPATLLHVGMLSVGVNDEELCSAGYQLLAAVCTYLNFDKSPIAAPKSGFVPGDPTTFVTRLSEALSEFVPQLTLDFISEISVAMTNMDRNAISQRVACIQYMRPWMKNLVHFVNPTSQLYERSGARIRDAIRILSDMSTSQPEASVVLTSGTQRYVWAEVGKLDPSVTDVVLDELIRSATDGGVGSTRCETIGLLIASMTSLPLRGKLIFKLRKALTKATGTKTPPKTLPDYPNWTEISTLIRLCYLGGYQSMKPGHNLFYVPDIFHLVTLTAGVGSSLVRKSVYGLVVNLLQAMYIGRSEDAPASELSLLMEECESPETQRLFGLTRLNTSSEYASFDATGDLAKVDSQERLTDFLIRTLEVTAGSRGLLNVWRARWMSLVSSSAFQYSPAIQIPAFTTLGSLLTEADDDFVYQMLVALRMALQQSSESDAAIVVTMIRSLAKAAPSLPLGSRYLVSLFWLAVALLQCSYITFYSEAASLLSVTLEGMRERGLFRHASVSTVLLEGRDSFDPVLTQFDSIMGISFDTNFSFALSAVLFKGLRTSIVKEAAESVLRTLLSVTMRPYLREGEVRDALSAEALGYFLALLPVSATHTSYRRLLKECNMDESCLPAINPVEDETNSPRVQVSLLGIDSPTSALLAASFLGVVVTTTSGNDAESEMLYCLLSDMGISYPDIVGMTYDGLEEKIHSIFSKSSNPVIIRAVSTIFRMAQDHDRLRSSSTRGASTSTLNTVEENTAVPVFSPGGTHLQALEDIGMGGVASTFVFLPPTGGHATKVIQWIGELLDVLLQP
ncbi:Ras-GAP domain-containing protein [Mycena indigotica]|uniref:Ras-GAP domain-containing protein n=1 Tax=Mycena indigotica TaxID=2126181 RepID=A0A8H6SNJ1_9AGAR|nr:Ras-GAP domain-containing protein [Mycena indigotica]KAF7302288.1 Ras-GAP domain-containing protein [Mycena indigotica]